MTDVLVVFSLGMNGNELGKDTLANLVAAKKLCEAKHFDTIVFTGGIFATGETIPAAKVMSDWWWEQRKVDEEGREPYLTDGMIAEVKSTITRQNVVNVLGIYSRYKLTSFADFTIVSERWHTLGIRLLFWMLSRKRVKAVYSDYKLPKREIAGRIARIFLYAIDPLGVGSMSKKIISQRGA